MLNILNILQSSYYKWIKTIEKPDRDLWLCSLIKETQQKTRQTYGYRRIKLALIKEYGLVVNHKKLLRIMNKFGLLNVIR